MRRVPLLLLLVLIATAALPLTGAAASCEADDRPVEARMREYPVVFKGRVVGLRDEDRTARFEVDEVWKGVVDAEVVVYGGPVQDAGFGQTVSTSNDRAWHGGVTYLVFAREEPRGFEDDACSPTREWTDDLVAARPADWSEPSPIVDDNDGLSGLAALAIIGAGLVAIAGAGAAVTAGRRRRA